MTSHDAGALKQLGLVAAGQAAKGVAVLSAAASPANLTGAVSLYRAGKTLSSLKSPDAGASADQLINFIVTTFTDRASRHFGSAFVLGHGGHGMDQILKYLPK